MSTSTTPSETVSRRRSVRTSTTRATSPLRSASNSASGTRLPDQGVALARPGQSEHHRAGHRLLLDGEPPYTSSASRETAPRTPPVST